MAATTQETIRELSHEEGMELLGHQAQRLGLSAEEFIAAYDRGDFDGTADETVLDVAMFLPFGR